MTIPNLVTILRFIIIPFYTFFLVKEDLFTAAVLYGIAAVSDILDGYLARKLNQRSSLGGVIDPVADKLIVIVSLFYLGYKNIFPRWGVLILFLKEFLMLLCGLYFLIKKIKIISSRIYGKLAMVMISVSILMALLNITFNTTIFMCGVTLSLIAGIDYLLYYLNILIKPYRVNK